MSSAVRAPGRSCLLANTNNVAPKSLCKGLKSTCNKSSEFNDPPGPDLSPSISSTLTLRRVFIFGEDLRTDVCMKLMTTYLAGAWWVNNKGFDEQ